MLGAHEVLGSLWKRRWTFLLTFTVVLVAAGAVTYTLPKVYETTSYLLVSSEGQGGSDFEATQTNQVLLKTFAELLQTRNVADAVAAELPFAVSGRTVRRTVEIRPIAQSQLIAITAEAGSPERAKLVADTYARVFLERTESRTDAAAASANVTLAEEGALVTTPARPRPLLNMLIGGLLAAVAASSVALVRQRLDQRLEIESGATELLGLPIIGRMPRARTSLEQLATARPGEPALAQLTEASRLLFANLAFANLGDRPKSLTVVSPRQGEGKSTCALMIGLAGAELGLRTALVDGDLRRPNLSAVLTSRRGENPKGGFSTYLVDPDSLLEGTTASGSGSLRFIPAGPLPPNPAALLGSDNLRAFERLARTSFDLVVFDTPPILVGADASLIAAATEGVVVVLDPWKTRRSTALEALDQLRRTQSRILGAVLNRVPTGHDSYSYYQETRATRGNGKSALAAPFSRRRRSRR